MRKISLFSVVCLLLLFVVTLVGCKKEETNTNNGGNGGSSGEYVDLGLPSGTKWKKSNENGNGTGLYTFDEAVSAFGNELPTKEQWEELKDRCTWEWQNNFGYKVTGQNGNSIILHADGFRGCSGSVVTGEGSNGYYWSSTPYDSEYAWYLYFSMGGSGMYKYNSRCHGHSVRLVQK